MPMPLIKQFEHIQIQLEAIKSATNNFSDDHCIGRGGFGRVYKGELVCSTGLMTVAIKRLNRAFGQGDPEFWKEIIMLSMYRHENIVSLLGFCDDSGEKILVYEYASRRSLELYLTSDDLTWIRRLQICIGAARGLAYLHSSVGSQRVLHRDIKSSNILLDENWNARISDLGLSKFGPANQQYTFLVSNAVGTIGYCDPLYVETGLLTKESDVYSFGVVLFEMLCGRLCILSDTDKRRPLTGLVRQMYEQNKIHEIIYEKIKDEINPSSLKTFTTIAYRCLNRNRDARPLMTEVVSMLETALRYQGIEKLDELREKPETRSMDSTFHIVRAGMEKFTMEDLLSAEAEVLGKGVLGTSYKAEIEKLNSVVRLVAVKRFRRIIIEEKLDFHAHVMFLGSLSHPNVLPCVACYFTEAEKLLVTDVASNGSLASHLHKKMGDEPGLDWRTRLKIIQGVASGVRYLYQEFPSLSLPHGHLKSSSVLLDDAFNPLLSDYAFLPIAKKEEAQQHMTAFKSPEFNLHGRVTRKTDVWCLGILILEMMTGRVCDYGDGKAEGMATWVSSIRREEWSGVVFDKRMKWETNSEIEVMDLLDMGLRCCESDIQRRWSMRKAVEKIQGLKEGEEDEEEQHLDLDVNQVEDSTAASEESPLIS